MIPEVKPTGLMNRRMPMTISAMLRRILDIPCFGLLIMNTPFKQSGFTS
jgi:hypothetical protein